VAPIASAPNIANVVSDIVSGTANTHTATQIATIATVPAIVLCSVQNCFTHTSFRFRVFYALVLQHEAQERAVDRDVTVVLDESKLLESIQKDVHPGARQAGHSRERVLREIWQHAGRRVRGPVPGEYQQRAGHP